jgi:GTP-binding protein
MSSVVAIVGRPNVGKSTIFNRLIGKRRAIESDVAGTTRDRLYQSMKLSGYKVLLVDTGGLELGKEGDDIEANVQEQSRVAIEGADIIVFVVDVRSELTSEDFHAADLLRKSKKNVILVANKCDNPTLEETRFNLYELGFGEPIAMTAVHSYGFDDLRHRLASELDGLGFKTEADEPKEREEGRTRIAFLGRPNVGKSTMVNGILGKKAVVVSNVPGTTRDSTELPFSYKEHDFMLIDTAGMRRRGKIEKGIEKYSILRTMQAVDEADVCVLMLDFIEGITSQDQHVSQYILEQKKGLIIVVNKVDLEEGNVREDLERRFIHTLRNKMAYVPWAPVVFSSALKRKNVFQILELSSEIAKERGREISQEDLNVWLDHALAKHAPKGKRGKRRFNVLGVEQVSTRPPSFVFSCEWPELMHFSYARYLENEIRSQFGFVGTSLGMTFRRPNDRGARRPQVREAKTRMKGRSK